MRRRDLLENKPYAYEVEYVESNCDNEQYIDTEFFITGPYQAKIRFSNPTKLSTDYCRLMGVGNSSSSSYHYCNIETSGTSLSAFSFTDRDGETASIGIKTNSKYSVHEIQVRRTNDTTVSVFYNQKLTGTSSASTISYEKSSAGSVYLFAMHRTISSGGSVVADSAVRFASYKLYSCSFKLGGELVRDFIPVVDKNGIACLYDKVSKKLFYNKGNGDLTAGPPTHTDEYVEVEYLQASNTQFINTLITPKRGYSSEIDFQLTTLDYASCLMGCFQASGLEDGRPSVMYHLTMYTRKWYFGSYTSAESNVSSSVDTNRHTVKLDGNGNTYLDGELVYSVIPTEDELDIEFHVLQRNNNSPTSTDNMSRTKIYDFKMRDQNNKLILWLVPARIGTVGCLVDKLTNRVYRNWGTSDFTLGPDL